MMAVSTCQGEGAGRRARQGGEWGRVWLCSSSKTESCWGWLVTSSFQEHWWGAVTSQLDPVPLLHKENAPNACVLLSLFPGCLWNTCCTQCMPWFSTPYDTAVSAAAIGKPLEVLAQEIKLPESVPSEDLHWKWFSLPGSISWNHTSSILVLQVPTCRCIQPAACGFHVHRLAMNIT